MYLRVFHDLWNSSLMAESVPVRWLFLTMLELADKGRSGVIDVPLFILARQAGMTEEETRAALTTLAAPDPSSRSEKEEGRRVVALRPEVERGWEIVNWEAYDALKRATDRRQQVKEAASRHREKIKSGVQVSKKEPLPAASSAVINRNPDVIKKHGMGGGEGSSSLLPSGSPERTLKSTPEVRDQDAPSAPSPSDLLRIWNENRGGMLPAKSLAGDRIAKARARLKQEPDLTVWADAVRRAAKDPFTTGTNSRGWKAGIDWLLRPGTLAKILEGSFDGNAPYPTRAEIEEFNKPLVGLEAGLYRSRFREHFGMEPKS
jgi:hypothetical protein